jgi:anti-sigma factor RsiW
MSGDRMSFSHDQITELDLMAYADGRLDAVRHRVVEAHLAQDPEARALVEAFVRQNESLRRALDPIAAEPVPSRLQAVLERPERPSLRPMLQAASVLGLALLSGLGGWWVGTTSSPTAGTPPTFLAGLEGNSFSSPILDSLEPLGRPQVEPRAAGAGLPEHGPEPRMIERAAPWFTDRVTVELVAPTLGASVASPELQRLVEIDGKPTVRFELAGPDGRAMALYLQTRPSTAAPDIHLVETTTGSTAYWQDGPLLWALTGEVEGADLVALARHIGTAIDLEPRLGTADAEHTNLEPLPTISPMTLAGG